MTLALTAVHPRYNGLRHGTEAPLRRQWPNEHGLFDVFHVNEEGESDDLDTCFYTVEEAREYARHSNEGVAKERRWESWLRGAGRA